MAIQQFNTLAELRIAIRHLEIKQASEWPPLKKQLLATAEILKPKYIIKDMFSGVLSEPALKKAAVSTTVGIVALLAANFFFPTRTASRLTKLLTGAIVGVSTIGNAVHHGSQIKLIGSRILRRLSGRQPTL